MELLNNPDKLTFIIDTLSSFSFPKSGGSIATHKLAYELAERGHNVYIFNSPFYAHKNIHIIPTEAFPNDDGWNSTFNWEGFSFNPERTISVYTQITWGNPFGVKHVARWILHDYDPEIWKTYGNNEIFFNYGTFKTPEGIEQKRLTSFDYGTDFYKNMNKGSRKGFGHILHKFTPSWGKEFLEHFGSTEIPNYHGKNGLDYLIEEFNKYEYVMTFDSKTYLTTAAALCGTKSIILNPDSQVSPMEFRYKNPIQLYGVAYGFNDIKYANSTIDFVKGNLLELERNDKKTVDNFIDFWEEKIKK
jgi:hypothetical protein